MRDDAWFEGLFRAHSTAVYRYFLRRAPADDAQDLTADVLATAWRRRADVPEGAELPWLYTTAGFVLANHRRKGRPVPVEHVPDEVDDDADPAHLALADGTARAALAALSPRDRRIILLHAWEGLDGEELAAVLGISRGGADAALSRARARLRQVWADLDAQDGDAQDRDARDRVVPDPAARGSSAQNSDDGRASAGSDTTHAR